MQEMLFKDYLSHPAISRSKLMDVLKSKWHYENDYITPSPEMALGTYIHEKILTPELNTFIVEPIVDRRTKIGKLEYSEFIEERDAKGLQSITQEQKERADGILKAFKTHSLCPAIVDMCEYKEATCFHKVDGVSCKARFDLLSEKNSMVVDLKTTRDASPEGFAKSLVNFKYHAQASFYLQMASLEFGRRFEDFIIIAVETSNPFGIAIYRVDSDAVALGDRMIEEAINRVKNLDNLPRVYEEVITTIDLPIWAYKKDV